MSLNACGQALRTSTPDSLDRCVALREPTAKSDTGTNLPGFCCMKDINHGGVRTQFHHIIDLMPTILEVRRDLHAGRQRMSLEESIKDLCKFIMMSFFQ